MIVAAGHLANLLAQPVVHAREACRELVRPGFLQAVPASSRKAA